MRSIDSTASFQERRLIATLTLLVALPATALAAGGLPDPTQPPQSQRRSPAAPKAAAAAPQLQSILIGEGRKPSAIISGRVVEVGDMVDDMRLTRLSENGALLTSARGQTLLTLTPGADKQRPDEGATGLRVAAQTGAHKSGAPNLPLRVAEQK